MLNPLTGKEWTDEEVEAEFQKCKDDPRYYYNTYFTVNGEKVRPLSQEEWNERAKIFLTQFLGEFMEQTTPGITVDSKDYFDQVNEHSRIIDETYKKEKP